MHVDRATFLVLTSSLFAACKEADAPTTTPIVIPHQPAPTASLARVEEPSQLAATDAGAPQQSVAAEEDEDPYDPEPGAAAVPLAKSIHGQTCDAVDNTKGTVACALKAPGPTCESLASTRSECARLRSWLVPRVAEKAAKCLQSKSGKEEICDYNIGAACVIQAFDSVCLDPSPKIDSSCRRVVSKCQSIERQYRHINLAACKAALSSIVPARHAKFLTCAQESCDLVPCHYAASQ